MTIVITGASRGIGFSLADKFGKEGNNLVLSSKNPEVLKASADELQNNYKNVQIKSFAADLAEKQEVKKFAAFVANTKLPVDILINNAGNFLPGSVYNEDEGLLEKMIAINLYSAYHLTRALLPGMMARKIGHVFNISSIAALKAYANGGSYSISKYALMGFSKNLREEMKPFNIKVTTVYPGAVYTSSWDGSGVEPQRIMEAKDIANSIYAMSQLSPQACVEDFIIRPLLGDLP
ncbi:MAG: SDR family NAD(P)-dependent oxidoreductase [Ginsengibacter sp.]